MMKIIKYLLAITVISFTISACGNTSQIDMAGTVQNSQNTTAMTESTTPKEETKQEILETIPDTDLAKFQVNESGKIMVVMFHNFIESYDANNSKMSNETKKYTNTFAAFKELLTTLYNKGYRLINVNDYIDNNIKVAAGFMPLIFTFDDGTAGQFNLVNENGKLVANKASAVGVMEEFNKEHPDFGLKGTFYVNLGGTTFAGEGTLTERLKYLIDAGFEIGNHTLNHINLKLEAKTKEKVEEEIGGNQKKMNELIPGYKMRTLALPLGNTTKDEALRQYVIKGEYQGSVYENRAIMLVGANPALAMTSSKVDLFKTPRVRASGILEEDMDFNWWLNKLTKEQQYVSDGDPTTITVPKDKESFIDKLTLRDKKIKTY